MPKVKVRKAAAVTTEELQQAASTIYLHALNWHPAGEPWEPPHPQEEVERLYHEGHPRGFPDSLEWVAHVIGWDSRCPVCKRQAAAVAQFLQGWGEQWATVRAARQPTPEEAEAMKRGAAKFEARAEVVADLRRTGAL